MLDAAGEQSNPLLGGLLAGWIEVGRDDFAAAQAKFDAMTGNDALTAYGQYHKALALALAGDFVSAETILAGGDDGPLHLNRSAIVAHAEILAQIGREADAIALIDEALAGGVPDAPLLDLRDRLAAGEEVPFDQITGARDGAAEAFLTLADALNTEEFAARRAGARPARRRISAPTSSRPSSSPPRSSRPRSSTRSPPTALAGVPADSPWYVTAEIRRANTQRAAGDPEAGIATLTALAASHGDRIEVASGARRRAAHGRALSRRRSSPTRRAIALIDDADAGALGALLHPRHRQRARRRLAGGRGRLPRGAEARARPAAGAELPRLQPGREAARTSTRRSA